uniref:Ovule protein n=2 Tax=Caenorhabditis tropicalis TaxID=1561998 RepID=A0A1I7T2J5_9PELO
MVFRVQMVRGGKNLVKTTIFLRRNCLEGAATSKAKKSVQKQKKNHSNRLKSAKEARKTEFPDCKCLAPLAHSSFAHSLAAAKMPPQRHQMGHFDAGNGDFGGFGCNKVEESMDNGLESMEENEL